MAVDRRVQSRDAVVNVTSRPLHLLKGVPRLRMVDAMGRIGVGVEAPLQCLQCGGGKWFLATGVLLSALLPGCPAIVGPGQVLVTNRGAGM